MKVNHEELRKVYNTGSLPQFYCEAVFAERIGFADDPVITVRMVAKETSGLVVFTRYLLEDFMKECGIGGYLEVDGTPTVQTHSRQEYFTDQHGHRRRGQQRDFHFRLVGEGPQYFIWANRSGFPIAPYLPKGFARPNSKEDWSIIADYWTDAGRDDIVKAMGSTLPLHLRP